MSDSFRKASDLVNIYFENISDENRKTAAVESSWRDILLQLKNSYKQSDTERVDIGSQLADHSRIIEYKNNTIFVETDHPARLQLFSFYKTSILNLIRQKYPELKLQNITFFIGRQKKEETNTLRDVTSEEIEKAIEKRTGKYEEKYECEKKEIPDAIKKMFEGFFK